MARVRKSTTLALHAQWASAVEDWTPTRETSSFWSYVLRFGVAHLVALPALERARRRQSDILFTGAYLDWCYTTLSDDFTPLLLTWRALGTDEVSASYQSALQGMQVEDAAHLQMLRHVVDFLGDAGWREVQVEAAKMSVEAHEALLVTPHAELAAAMVLHALALKATGQLDEAVSIGQKALAMHRATLHREDPALYVSVNSMASILNAAKRFDEAEPLFREAVEHRTLLLGPGHPKTLISVASFAFMLTKMGKHEASEPLHRRAYEGRVKLLGRHHPKTLTSCVNFGRCLSELGHYDEAEEILKAAVEGRRLILGPEHSRTLNAAKRLRECREAAGRELP